MKHSLLLLLIFCVAFAAFPAKPKAKPKKTVNVEAVFEDAERALMEYDIDRLSEAVDRLEGSKLDSADSQRLRELQNRLIALRNMLERVEQIVIVDSMSVDTATFFSHYRLLPEAGKIGGTSALTNFTPAAGREVFFTETAENGKTVIKHSGILDDGTREEAETLEITVPGSEGSQAYPFMLADGTTLYFASDADSDASLGGLDIYMTRRDAQGNYYEATNVGMPYNSPGNDYMMAIDEASGLGWWATDRNSEEGMVTIYVFKPNETRVNYEPDRDDIADLAFITSVAATQPAGFNKEEALKPLAGTLHGASAALAPAFELPVGSKLYTSLKDFRNPTAAQAMSDYLKVQADLAKLNANLDALRARYSKGDRSVAEQILSGEAKENALRTKLRSMRNAVIRLETGEE